MPKIEALLQQSVEQTLSGVVCPNLNEQAGACRIYDSRPIACRAYGFFVARDHDQDCEPIETAVNDRGEAAIIWGHAEALRQDVARLSGQSIAFATHYRDHLKPDDMAAKEHQGITQAPGSNRLG